MFKCCYIEETQCIRENMKRFKDFRVFNGLGVYDVGKHLKRHPYMDSEMV